MFEERIRIFVIRSGIDFGHLSQALGESLRFVMQWWNRPHELRLTDRHFANLAAFLDLPLEALLNDDLPIENLRQRFIEGPIHVNERYFVDAFSNVRTTAHIARYLSIRFGRARVDQVLRQMGVHPCVYSNLDNKINIDYFVDLLEAAKRMGLGQNEIHHLSSYMFLTMKNTEIGRQFAEASNYLECYGVLNRNFKNFDHNFIYDMSLHENGFTLAIRPGEVLARKIHDHEIDCTNLAIYRKIMACWFPYLSGLPPLLGKLNRSLAFGDDLCVIEAHFPDSPVHRLKPPQIQIV